MTLREKSLYHQIHPAKLFTDWSTGIVALFPLWAHNLIAAMLIALVPSVVVSLVIILFADLEKYKQSSFGKYLGQYMTRPVQMIRFAGYGIMAAGAWYHVVWLIPTELLVILAAWLRGVTFPGRPS